MNQSGKRPYPWGLWVTLACLTVLVLVILRTFGAAGKFHTHLGESAAILAVGSVFLIGRWLHNSWWGLVNAVVLIAHPLFFHWATDEPQPLLAEALELVVLAATVGGWLLIGNSACNVYWVLIFFLSTFYTALLWGIKPTNGLVASLLIFMGFLSAALWGFSHRKKTGAYWGNWVAALLMALASPVVALYVAYWGGNYKWFGTIYQPSVNCPHNPLDFLLAAVDPDFASQEIHGLAPADLERWAWPVVWVILPLMVWGLWRSLRRGWKQWQQHQAPLSWLLTLFALLDIAGVALHPASARATFFLPLASLAVLLSVFCLADLLRGMGERLVLEPPGEKSG